MKALSLREPWAGLIRSGKKTIETRTWSSRYRGEVLICASKLPASPLAGQAVAVAKLVDCRPMTKADEAAAGCELYPKAVAWILEEIRPIRPFPVKGTLGLTDVDVLVEAEISAERKAMAKAKKKKQAAKATDKGSVEKAEPTAEDKLQNIIEADEAVTDAARALRATKAVAADQKADLAAAEARRDALIHEAANGLPLDAAGQTDEDE